MNKKFLVNDCGLYVSLANDLAMKGRNEVIYYTNYGSAFPSYKEYASGDDFGYLTKKEDFFDHVDSADCIATFDVSNNDLIHYLRKKYPDKSIFGAGFAARLEEDRVAFKKWLEVLKLPSIPYKTIKGFPALREHLKTHPKQVVKINIFRQDFETLACETYEDVKQILDNRAAVLGPYADECIFIVEDFVESVVEAGFDGFCVDGRYIPFSSGIEYDKNLYIGRVGHVPDALMDTLDAFSPVFKRMKYRGALSTEERIVSSKEHYFIDPCCRVAMPLGVLYGRYIKNWDEVVYEIGLGNDVEIECDHKYFGAFALVSQNALEYYTLVNIEKGHEDDFRFQMATQTKKGDRYAVKGLESVITLVAAGDSVNEVVDKLQENIKWVKAYGLETDTVKSIEGIKEQIKKAHSVGIDI